MMSNSGDMVTTSSTSPMIASLPVRCASSSMCNFPVGILLKELCVLFSYDDFRISGSRLVCGRELRGVGSFHAGPSLQSFERALARAVRFRLRARQILLLH